jgi:hypothetical protein
MDIASLREFMEREIDRYVYHVPDGSVGQPMPDQWVQDQLAEFRLSLVTPRWVTIRIRDTPEQMMDVTPVHRDCVLIADDRKGYQLYFDPEQRDFVLACTGSPPETVNVRGDAVGCFMAR